MKTIPTLIIAVAASCFAHVGHAVVIGQVDTFEDGTTNNWTIALVGLGTPPPQVLPTNVPTGGPSGAGDNYLRLSSSGLTGAGGRLTAINFQAQWAGNYITAGVGAIRMDVNNLGNSDLDLRLLISDPLGGPPANVAFSSQAIHIPSGSGWMSVLFPIGVGDLTAAQGSVFAALSNATELRIFHSTTPEFPGAPIAATLGMNNITAVGTAVPEHGASWILFASGVLSVFAAAQWRHSRVLHPRREPHTGSTALV